MTKDLTQGSPAKLIFEFAVPLLAGMVFQQLYNLVDTVIVGRFLGVNALAGVGATGSIGFLVLGFGMGICAGFAIPVAQYFGAKDESRMRNCVANGLLLAGVFALLIAVVMVAFCRSILTLIDTPAECFEEAYRYIVVIFAGTPFIFMYNLFSGYLRSLGDSKTPLCFLLLSSVLNIALDLLFILTFHMGVIGASLATVISQGVSGMLCLLFIVKKVPILHISGEEWRISRKVMGELCKYGVPFSIRSRPSAALSCRRRSMRWGRRRLPLWLPAPRCSTLSSAPSRRWVRPWRPTARRTSAPAATSASTRA